MLLASAIAAAVACTPCHPRIVQQFERSRMAQSFTRASAPLPAGRYEHRLSQRSYEVVRRDGADWLIRRSEAGEVERRIDFIVGSGSHARSFLSRTAHGRLIELPLSWYAADGGYYAMSPGYDRPDHQDFRREVSPECLF